MNAVAAGHTYAIEERFDKALKLVRAALTAGDLEIVGEMDMPANWPGESRKRPPRCRVLLVDCPLLLFEGLAWTEPPGSISRCTYCWLPTAPGPTFPPSSRRAFSMPGCLPARPDR